MVKLKVGHDLNNMKPMENIELKSMMMIRE